MRYQITRIPDSITLVLGATSVIGFLNSKPFHTSSYHSYSVKSEFPTEHFVQKSFYRLRSSLLMTYDDECKISHSSTPPIYCTEREYLKNATVEILTKPSPLTPAELSEINHIIKGWSNKQKNGAVHVERLIKKIVDEKTLTDSSYANGLLTTELYNNLIYSWVPSWSKGEMTEEHAIAAAERAETILR